MNEIISVKRLSKSYGGLSAVRDLNLSVIQVQRFSPLSSRQQHGSIQAGTVQEELRVLHLHLKAARRLASRKLG